jgi:hypothetical protein
MMILLRRTRWCPRGVWWLRLARFDRWRQAKIVAMHMAERNDHKQRQRKQRQATKGAAV